jgi:hypothetical protein
MSSATTTIIRTTASTGFNAADDFTFNAGDSITLTGMVGDEWTGTVERTGKTGSFPRSYVVDPKLNAGADHAKSADENTQQFRMLPPTIRQGKLLAYINQNKGTAVVMKDPPPDGMLSATRFAKQHDIDARASDDPSDPVFCKDDADCANVLTTFYRCMAADLKALALANRVCRFKPRANTTAYFCSDIKDIADLPNGITSPPR